jgi:hypothetical protein
MANGLVKQNCQLSCCGGNRLGLADSGGQPPIEGLSPVRVRPGLTAAMRNCAAARLDERRVLELSNLPPEILLPEAKLSQSVKCLTAGHLRISFPHSAINRRTV